MFPGEDSEFLRKILSCSQAIQAQNVVVFCLVAASHWSELAVSSMAQAVGKATGLCGKTVGQARGLCGHTVGLATGVVW